ncbi:MAG: beta-L-arabinofuranosidase domain-containing protein [Candidatus Solibacter sp.]
MSAFTRRTFAGIAAATPALLAQTPQAPAAAPVAPPQRQGPPPPPDPFDVPIEFHRRDVAPKVRPFAMTQVRLLPGSMFHDAQEWNRGYMARLSADRLLYNFRLNAGLPAPGGGFPGGADNWELPTIELRGHFTGHFLTASANLWASTGDQAAKAKADEMVDGLAKVQQKLGGGYLSAFPISLFERLDRLAGVPRQRPAAGGRPSVDQTLPWAPFYTIHKIMAGLFDMYQFAGNKQALEVVSGMADWADQWSASKTEEHMQQILEIEFGGIAETLYHLAAATNSDKWVKAGDRFQKKRFINPLALRRDQLTGLHMNTHVPQAIAAARRYELSGDPRFHDVAEFFYWAVTNGRTYVTGGSSTDEHWVLPPGQIAAELKRSSSHEESCCSYNMLKLARQLYSWSPEPHYFDYYERTLLNDRLGTIEPKTGVTQYFASLTPGAWKTFSEAEHSFWCCTGSGVEEYAKLNDSIYWHDDAGLYVNLFVASELNWPEKGLKVQQESSFPQQQATRLTITAAKPQELAIRLRVPKWAQGSTVSVNGKPLDAGAEPGSYLTIRRQWKSGDRIEMTLPMRLSVEATPDDPATQAFLYGPLVLAADLGSEGVTDAVTYGMKLPAVARGRNGQPPALPELNVPALKAASPDPASWIKPAGAPLTFRTTGQQKDITLIPLNSLFRKRYAVYWKVS